MLVKIFKNHDLFKKVFIRKRFEKTKINNMELKIRTVGNAAVCGSTVVCDRQVR